MTTFPEDKTHSNILRAITICLNSNRRILLVSLILVIPLTTYLDEILSTVGATTKPSFDITDPYQKNVPLFEAVKANRLLEVQKLLASSKD